MTYVACEVLPGLRESEVTVAVQDVDGAKAYLRVEKDFLETKSGDSFLPIGIIHVDEENEKVLIELPHEADSGVNRLWVPSSDIHAGGQRSRAPA